MKVPCLTVHVQTTEPMDKAQSCTIKDATEPEQPKISAPDEFPFQPGPNPHTTGYQASLFGFFFIGACLGIVYRNSHKF